VAPDWGGAPNRLDRASAIVGSPGTFLLSLIVILIWAVTGPIFHYSDTWQLVINTGTSVVTFLMVFLIQNTENRDAKAMHLKLDELIRAVTAARTRLVHLENLSDEDLTKLDQEFEKLHEKLDDKLNKIEEKA
jgi:low affinity Fe/Cu permease